MSNQSQGQTVAPQQGGTTVEALFQTIGEKEVSLRNLTIRNQTLVQQLQAVIAERDALAKRVDELLNPPKVDEVSVPQPEGTH